MAAGAAIEQALRAKFLPQHLEVEDQSARHAGHSGARPGGETHFRVTVVSGSFAGLSRIDRHRLVQKTVFEELGADIHALVIAALTPEEWAAKA